MGTNKKVKLAMLFGSMMGDGWLSVTDSITYNTKRYQCGFSGDRESLEIIKKDLISLFGDIGKAEISTTNTYSEKYGIEGVTSKFVCNVKVTKEFLKLGMPIGKRVEKSYTIPEWIFYGSNDIKKAFLSGYYAAEGYTPAMQTNDRTLKVLGITITKRKRLEESLNVLLEQFTFILNEFGIEHSIKRKITKTIDYNIKAEIIINNSVENIERFINITDIRYCVNKKKEFKILKHYYRTRTEMLEMLSKAYKEAMVEGSSPKAISEKYGITKRQVLHWKASRSGSFRIPNSFPTYTEFKKKNRYCPL